MNKQFKEQAVINILVQSVEGKQPYIAPQCEVIPIEQVSFYCASIPLKKDELSGGGQGDYDEDEEKDGGTGEINICF